MSTKGGMCFSRFLNSTECPGPGLLEEEDSHIICKLAGVPYKPSSLKIPNPVVQYSELSTDQQENLQAQIEILNFEMHTEFLKFEQTVKSFCERFAATDIARTLSLHCKEFFAKSVSKSGNIQALLYEEKLDTAKVFAKIHPYYSYYNYDLLKVIVFVYGSEKDEKNMRQYILKFSNYCKRVPCVEFYDDGCQTVKQVELKFNIDYNKELLTPADTKNIRNNVSKILNIMPSMLLISPFN